MIMGASTFPGVLVRGSRMRFATSGRGLGDLMTDCEGPHPNCSPLDQACVANWQNIVSSCSPVPPGASLTRDLATSSPKFAAQLAAAGGDEMLALQAQGNPVLPSHPAAAWWGGPGASVAGNPLPYSSAHINPGATPTNPLQQQVRINPTNLPIHPLDPRPSLRGGYGQNWMPPGGVIPGWYSTIPVPMVGSGLGRLGRRRTRGFGQPQVDAFGNPVSCPAGQHYAVGACIELCNQSTVADQFACVQRNEAAWAASPNVGTPPPYIPAPSSTVVVQKQPPAVVNPSPTTQLTNTGSSQASPTSVLNLSRGVISPPLISYTGQVSTVGGSVSGSWFSDPTRDVISGLPNWALLVMAGAGLFVVVNMASKR